MHDLNGSERVTKVMKQYVSKAEEKAKYMKRTSKTFSTSTGTSVALGIGQLRAFDTLSAPYFLV